MVALGEFDVLDAVAGGAHQVAGNTTVQILLLVGIPDPPSPSLGLRRLAAVLLGGERACGGSIFRCFCFTLGVLRIVLGRLCGSLGVLCSQFCRFRIVLGDLGGGLSHKSGIF